MKKPLLKKLITGILTASLGITALTGCGSSSEQPTVEANVGDTVRIAEVRPLSKTKHFRLVEVVEKAVIL